MTVDKTLIAHIVAELIVISGLSFYYHKKCSNLQLQINDLNSKLEKMNGNSYLNTIKRQELFESQTVQQINKLYSILNTMNNSGINSGINSDTSRSISDNIIKESFYTPINDTNISNENRSSTSQGTGSSSITSHKQIQQKPTHSNPLMSTLSMLGPLTTMFKVVMEPKPPHPNEVFEKIDIKSEINSRKIVEIEDDDEINSETLDNELRDELDDLHSNVTSTINTPILTPKLSLLSNLPKLDLCENGVCKLNLNYENDKNNESINEDDNPLNIQKSLENVQPVVNVNQNDEKINKSDKSSPLRYISQAPETKRGRPKKNQ